LIVYNCNSAGNGPGNEVSFAVDASDAVGGRVSIIRVVGRDRTVARAAALVLEDFFSSCSSVKPKPASAQSISLSTSHPAPPLLKRAVSVASGAPAKRSEGAPPAQVTRQPLFPASPFRELQVKQR